MWEHMQMDWHGWGGHMFGWSGRLVMLLLVVAVVDGNDASDTEGEATVDSDGGDDADSARVDCPTTPVFKGAWGEHGSEPGHFMEPSSVELHSDGTVIVAGHEDVVIDESGGHIYVADVENHQVLHLVRE